MDTLLEVILAPKSQAVTFNPDQIKSNCNRIRELMSDDYYHYKIPEILWSIKQQCFNQSGADFLLQYDPDIFELITLNQLVADQWSIAQLNYCQKYNIPPPKSELYKILSMSAEVWMEKSMAILFAMQLSNQPDFFANHMEEIKHIIVGREYKEFFAAIQKYIPDINWTDVDGFTLLHLAVMYRNHSMIRSLSENGCDLNKTDRSGSTPLHVAIWIGEDSVFKTVLALQPNLSIADNDGQTPLHLSIFRRSFHFASALIENGAEPKLKNKAGQTSIQLYRSSRFVPKKYQNLL